MLVVSNLTKTVEEKFVTDRPIIPDLSGSRHGDSAAQFSDVVMFLYEDGYYNPETEKKGIAEIIIAKNATGPSGTCELVHLTKLMHYVSLAN
ncbi:MAG: hypothetical protein K5649_00035 [Lachnospiraceae bacterium]|nr:hypothetical protein [Lachnospiraceae bacterium]